jgi:DNA-binding NarL/FixJ family response regulator
VVDRHHLLVAAITRLITSPPLNATVMTATRSADAVEIAGRMPIELAVCDVRAAPVGGNDLPAALLGQRPGLRLVLLAEAEDAALLMAALRSGAIGFFTKDTGVQEFLDGVETALKGQYVVGRNLLQRVLSKLDSGQDEAPQGIARLSPAEHRILAMIGQAQSIQSIAATQGISQKTVRNHLASVYRKLQLRNRTEAILWAARMGVT